MDVAGGAGGVSYLEMKRLPRGSEVDEMIGLRNRKREREREREREGIRRRNWVFGKGGLELRSACYKYLKTV